VGSRDGNHSVGVAACPLALVTPGTDHNRRSSAGGGRAAAADAQILAL